MTEQPIPFSLEIPIVFGHVRVHFFLHANNFSCGVCCISKPHNHKDYELRYVSAGRGNQIIETEHDGLYEIETEVSDILLIHPKEYHYQTTEKCSEDLAQYSLCFGISLPTRPTAEQKRAYEEMESHLAAIRRLRDTDGRLLPLFSRLMEEIHGRPLGFFPYISSLCTMILTELLRLGGAQNERLFPASELRYNGYWRGCIDYFFRHRFHEDVKLCDLAHAVRTSERHASRCVQRLYGKSFSEKLLEYRIEQAKFELLHTEKSISRIAQDNGFQSSTYFSTGFRKLTGVSPTAFRAAYSIKSRKT